MSNGNGKGQQVSNQVQKSELETLRTQVAEMKDLIEKKDKANEVRKRMLAWLVKDQAKNRLPLFLYAMSDVCEEEEIHQIIDYMKTIVDQYDASLIQSYRKQIVEMVGVRKRMELVKAEALAAKRDDPAPEPEAA